MVGTSKEMSALEDRIRRLEDRAAIEDLVARYGFAIDNRDIDGIAACFSPEGAFRSVDGKLDARGREAVVEQFHGRFAALGPSNHFTHDHIVRFDAADPDRASGRLNSHAEVLRNDRPMIVALRYDDRYLRGPEGWQFEDRLLSFFYYLDVTEYAEYLGNRMRMRAYPDPQPADWPEGLETWRRYERSRG